MEEFEGGGGLGENDTVVFEGPPPVHELHNSVTSARHLRMAPMSIDEIQGERVALMGIALKASVPGGAKLLDDFPDGTALAATEEVRQGENGTTKEDVSWDEGGGEVMMQGNNGGYERT